MKLRGKRHEFTAKEREQLLDVLAPSIKDKQEAGVSMHS
jgi:hypothetical protein